MRTAATLVLSFVVSACSTIDKDNYVDGWPELKIIENKVSFNEVQKKCRPYVSWGVWPLACAEFYLAQAVCKIWYTFEVNLEHERQHCLGYDHPGSNHMREMLKEWKGLKS